MIYVDLTDDRTQNISFAFCMASTRCHAGLKGLIGVSAKETDALNEAGFVKMLVVGDNNCSV